MNNIMRVVYDKAIAEYRKKNYEIAAAFFEQLSQRVDDSSVVTYLGGVSFFRIKNYDKALDFFKATIAKKKNYYHTSHAQIFLGLIYIDKNNFAKAKEILQKPIANNFPSAVPYSLLGYIANKEKKYEVAEKHFSEALKIDTNNPSFHNNMGFNYLEWNKLEKADFHLKKALEKNSKNPYYLHSMGWLFFIMKNFKTAKRFMKRALSIKNMRQVSEDLKKIEEKIIK